LACTLIEESEEPPSLGELAEAVGLSPHHLQRLFKAIVGVTPKAYAAAKRAERFRDGLRKRQTVTHAMYQAGFRSSSRCYEHARDELGMTPGEYKRGGQGQSIRYATAPCDLGWLIVAATERGICLIEFADKPEDTGTRLAKRFPQAELVEGDAEFSTWVTQVVQFIEVPRRGLELPLDVQGTVFQRRVWKALQTIPLGSTKSYAEIAQQIGQPTAVRAVAQACGANPIAVAIPCHRVVGSNGKLTGYRGGIERKQALLDREAK
jgi:AraC family transcriptional regulator of adaptative response/methylated-DNA-[protein]-cysteine methyltransferase